MAQRSRFTLLLRGTLVCGSVLTALFIGEIICRFTNTVAPDGYIPSPNAKLIYELQPNFNMHWMNGVVSPQGLADRIYTETKPAGVYRIAVVSDSVGFGFGGKMRDSYPREMERLLAAEEPGRYEIMNFSVPGYNTSQEAEVVRTKVLRFHPDLVILGFSSNDVTMCNWMQPDFTPWNFLVHRSFLATKTLRAVEQWVDKASPRAQARWLRFKVDFLGLYNGQRIYGWPGLTTVAPEEQRPDHLPEKYRGLVGVENYRKFLSDIKETLERAGIALISTGFVEDDTWFTRTSREVGIDYVYPFLTPLKRIAAAQHRSPGEFVIPHDGHFNVEGNKVVARILVDYLRREHFGFRPTISRR